MLGRGNVVVTLKLARCTLPVHSDLVTIIGSNRDEDFNKAFLLSRSCYKDSPPAFRARDPHHSQKQPSKTSAYATQKAAAFYGNQPAI